jgi:hypothetical protein
MAEGHVREGLGPGQCQSTGARTPCRRRRRDREPLPCQRYQQQERCGSGSDADADHRSKDQSHGCDDDTGRHRWGVRPVRRCGRRASPRRTRRGSGRRGREGLRCTSGPATARAWMQARQGPGADQDTDTHPAPRPAVPACGCSWRAGPPGRAGRGRAAPLRRPRRGCSPGGGSGSRWADPRR